jgi:hypothetical protein
MHTAAVILTDDVHKLRAAAQPSHFLHQHLAGTAALCTIRVLGQPETQVPCSSDRWEAVGCEHCRIAAADDLELQRELELCRC